MKKSKKRVLILGGGFAGMYAALHLDRTLARDPDMEVTLVNRENFFLFTPMLHEVAASDLDMTHIVNPIRQMISRVNFIEGEVEAIDLPGQSVRIALGGNVNQRHTLEYDHLILALGASTNFFGIPGLAENALTMKSLGDAIYLRNRLIALLEEADAQATLNPDRKVPLTVLVAGGGFAGVETVAAIHDFLQEARRFYPHLSEDSIRTLLVHAGSYLLPELGEKLGRYAGEKLGERGIEIRTDTRVTGLNDGIATLSDGTHVPVSTLIWTAGTAPHPLLETLPCAHERGRVMVNSGLAVPEWPGVWALGDCAVVPDRVHGGACPPTAQYALRQGKIAAHNIMASLRGEPLKPFVFGGLGQLAAIGRRTGVASVLGFQFSGFAAWWLWRTVYLSKLPRFEKKLRVALDWTLDLLFSKDLVQFTTARSGETPSASLMATGGPR